MSSATKNFSHIFIGMIDMSDLGNGNVTDGNMFAFVVEEERRRETLVCYEIRDSGLLIWGLFTDG
jgi:hypothetical protein